MLELKIVVVAFSADWLLTEFFNHLGLILSIWKGQFGYFTLIAIVAVSFGSHVLLISH